MIDVIYAPNRYMCGLVSRELGPQGLGLIVKRQPIYLTPLACRLNGAHRGLAYYNLYIYNADRTLDRMALGQYNEIKTELILLGRPAMISYWDEWRLYATTFSR